MKDCLFCKMVNGEVPCQKLYEDEYCFAILDLHPAAIGHTLVIPKKHYTDLMELDNDTLIHINDVAKRIIPILMNKFNCTSCSTRVNYGDSQVIKHYHLHILPNYFITKPTLTQSETYEILKDVKF